MLKKIAIPELLFVVYFWGLVLLRPFLQENMTASTLILTGFVFTLVLFYCGWLMFRRDQNVEVPIVVMGIVCIVFLADAVFRLNSHSYNLLYEFIYFGIVPVLFLSKVTFVRQLLVYFSYAAVFAFALYGMDPLSGYDVFSDYMGYGYKLALPAFLGTFIGFHYLKVKWMVVFEIISFLSLMMFANRSALLAAVVFIIFYIFFHYSFNLIAIIKRVLVFGILIALAYINIDPLMDSLFRFTSEAGFQSYAIQKLNYFISSGSADEIFFSGRIHIWKQALDMILEQPILGHGAGRFQHVHGYYPHNILLDVLVSAGLIGFMAIAYFIFRSSKTLIQSSGDVRIFSLMMLALWFPKLLFSMMFINDTAFWCYFVLFLFPFVKANAKNSYTPRIGMVHPG